jgi:hypothetical protein
MKFNLGFILGAALLFCGHSTNAQAPQGATGQCKDGSYSTAKSKSGACRGHKGVQTWYAPAATTPTPASTPAVAPAPTHATPAPATAATPTPTPTPSSPAAQPARAQSASSTAAAAGGGPGLVWVNLSSKVYHCYGTRYYGTTKNGKYMSEADASSMGARPDAGKACTK